MAKSKKKGKEVHFYCEFCGTEVEKMAFQCPKCHRIFDSIKCPQCGHTGKAEEFPNGCPVCGFQSSSLNKMREDIMEAKNKAENGHSANSNGETHPSSNARTVETRKKPKKKEIILPAWAYIVLILLLLGVGITFGVIIKIMLSF